jgi:DNA-binding transcriptional ArsR family regulator
MQAQSKGRYAAGLNAALFKALAHPMRYRIIMAAAEREVTPTELAEILDEPFQKVYAQVRVLAEGDEPLLELVDTDTRKGGAMHYYRSVVRPVVDATAWDELPLIARETTTAVNTTMIIGEISASVSAARFDSHPNRSIVSRPIRVDGPGAERIERALIALDRECVEAERESAERATADEDHRLPMLSANFLFQRAD